MNASIRFKLENIKKNYQNIVSSQVSYKDTSKSQSVANSRLSMTNTNLNTPHQLSRNQLQHSRSLDADSDFFKKKTSNSFNRHHDQPKNAYSS